MLDRDLAKLYQVETKRVNESVKNNPEKFPERFAWKLTKEEIIIDEYVVVTLLDIIKELNTNEILITKNKTNSKKLK